jgi:hypothetical protein
LKAAQKLRGVAGHLHCMAERAIRCDRFKAIVRRKRENGAW